MKHGGGGGGLLFGDDGGPVVRYSIRSPSSIAYWAGADAGLKGEPDVYRGHPDDEPVVAANWHAGWRLGRLFRQPLGFESKRSSRWGTKGGGNTMVNATRKP